MTSLIRLADLPSSSPVLALEAAAARASSLEDKPRTSVRDPVRDPALSSQDLEISRLRDALSVAEKKLDELVAAAREQGRKEGRESAVRDQAKAISALESGVSDAVTLVRAKAEELEGLALAVAETALANVFANPKLHRQLVVDAIQRQLREVRRETVLAVHVSAADFPEAGGLTELARTLGHADIRLLHDPALDQGACRIDLRLGAIELSLSEHWDAIRTRLKELATLGGAR